MHISTQGNQSGRTCHHWQTDGQNKLHTHTLHVTIGATKPPPAATCLFTQVPQVIKSYLGPQEEKLHTQTHTHVQTRIPADSQWKQTAFPFPLPVPMSSRVSGQTPPPPTTSATYKKVLFLIFLAFWQKREAEVSGVKGILSNQNTLPFLAARLPAVTEQ